MEDSGWQYTEKEEQDMYIAQANFDAAEDEIFDHYGDSIKYFDLNIYDITEKALESVDDKKSAGRLAYAVTEAEMIIDEMIGEILSKVCDYDDGHDFSASYTTTQCFMGLFNAAERA